VIGRFFRHLFTGRQAAAPASPPVDTPAPVPIDDSSVDAWPGDRVEDHFYRLLMGADQSDEAVATAEEVVVLRNLREAFGTERFNVATLPRLPAVVPQLMRSLRSDEVDSRTMANQIARDPVLVGEVIRVANSAFFRGSRAVSSLPQAVTLLGQDGLRRVVMQLVMRPILRTDASETSRLAGERLWDHADAAARACAFLGRPACDGFEAFLAGLVSLAGMQTVLLELGSAQLAGAPSRAFISGVAQQVERLTLHAARQWEFPSRVVQALAERADPADAGAHTPLGRALAAAVRVAMLEVLVAQAAAPAEAVLRPSPLHGFSQERLAACRDYLRETQPA
jgi:HD-like signal output (HDOD) protein